MFHDPVARVESARCRSEEEEDLPVIVIRVMRETDVKGVRDIFQHINGSH